MFKVYRRIKMKRSVVLFGILTILVFVFFSGCAFPSYAIHAKKLEVIPDNFVNISEQQMVEFPHLKEAVTTQYVIDTPKEVFDALTDLLDTTATGFIRYKDEYYEIAFVYGD